MRTGGDQPAGRPAGVVLCGCGAVSRLYAAPALARLEAEGVARAVAVFDPDPAAVAAVRAILPGAVAATTPDALFGRGADCAIIASPPRFHAVQTLAALEAGLTVLCEKPLATDLADADRMIAAATPGRVLAAGLVRRHMPAAAMVRTLLGAGALGPLESIDWFEGGPFDWPVSGPSYFSRDQSGGGVLPDIGTHVIDLLGWWLGPPALTDYADDAMGGVEANCRVRLDAGGCPVQIRLSRDWARPNRVVIRGERADLAWIPYEPETLELTYRDPRVAPARLDLGRPGRPAMDFIDCYAAQIRDLLNAAAHGGEPLAPASAGRDALALVEACRAAARPMPMPWLAPAAEARSGDRP